MIIFLKKLLIITTVFVFISLNILLAVSIFGNRPSYSQGVHISANCSHTHYVQICHHQCRGICLDVVPGQPASRCCYCACPKVREAIKYEHRMLNFLYICGGICLFLVLIVGVLIVGIQLLLPKPKIRYYYDED